MMGGRCFALGLRVPFVPSCRHLRYVIPTSPKRPAKSFSKNLPIVSFSVISNNGRVAVAYLAACSTASIDIKAVNIASNLLTLSALIYKPHGVCFPSFSSTPASNTATPLSYPSMPHQRDAFRTLPQRDPFLARPPQTTPRSRSLPRCLAPLPPKSLRYHRARHKHTILASYKHLFPTLHEHEE